jgi:hypothetical protein
MRTRTTLAALCAASAFLAGGSATAAIPRPPDPCDYDPRVDCGPVVRDEISKLVGILCKADATMEVTRIVYTSDVASYDEIKATGGGSCPLDHTNDELDVDGAVAVIGAAGPVDPLDPESGVSKTTCNGHYGVCHAVIENLPAEPGPITIQSLIEPTTRRPLPAPDHVEATYVLRQRVFEA